MRKLAYIKHMPDLIIRLSGIKWSVFSLVFISLGKKNKIKIATFLALVIYIVSSTENDRNQWKE